MEYRWPRTPGGQSSVVSSSPDWARLGCSSTGPRTTPSSCGFPTIQSFLKITTSCKRSFRRTRDSTTSSWPQTKMSWRQPSSNWSDISSRLSLSFGRYISVFQPVCDRRTLPVCLYKIFVTHLFLSNQIGTSNLYYSVILHPLEPITLYLILKNV